MKGLILPVLTFIILFLSHQTYSDDTEIYINNTNSSKVRPNIMFVMDTSGSMGWDAPVAQEEYDPSITYTGYGRFNSNLYYKEESTDYYIAVSVSCSEVTDVLDSTGLYTGLVNGLYHLEGWWWKRWVFDGYACHNPDTANGETQREENVTLWDGNYLNYLANPPAPPTQSRIEVARQAFRDVIEGLSDVNAGLMHFGPSADGGTIDVPISPIEDVKSDMISKVNGFVVNGGTPLVESIYEGMLYFSGGNVKYGWQSHSGAFKDSTKAKYKSPITQSCQNNHMVLFTDGVASSDEKVDADVRELLKSINASRPSDLSTNCKHNHDSSRDVLIETCLEELAFSLNNGDYSAKDGSQNIQLYTIGGFDLGQTDFLERTATLGGGQYSSASSASEIVTSLTEILNDILSVNTTFTAPAVSVNAFNTSEHRDELFYALFRPEKTVKWAGNLKKYRITDNGIVLGQKNGVPAISETTGFFNEGIFDLWNNSGKADGKDIEQGGFANRLQPSTRNIYTIQSESLEELKDLSLTQRKSLYGNPNISDGDIQKLTNWVYGYDVDDLDGDGETTDSRNSIGDPLHSEPLIITYGGTNEKPDATIFFGTNEGFLHAIKTDTDSIEEHFAFIPEQLLANQDDYYQDSAGSVNKPYGMDGLISAWVYDKNQDNLVLNTNGSLQTGEHVYLYAGMRRGGRNYYALDVSDRSNPSLLFKIEGGTGDFARLGQTWSKMTLAKVKWKGESKFVAFFTGGYDPNQDSNTTKEDDGVGNAIYMIDAETGKRLWWTSRTGANLNISDMRNSIPASVSAIDITGDGHIDYFFAADTGGRVFRIDIDQDNTSASNFAKGGMIASLSGTSTTDNRRFYNKPDVSIIKDKNEGDHLVISVGSGHRAFPISTKSVENRMYVIHDFSPYTAPSTYSVATEAPSSQTSLGGSPPDPLKLYNVTALAKGGTMTADYQQMLKGGAGWYITLDSTGEKILSESIAFAGALIFTSFSPTSEQSSVCGPDKGVSSVYALNLEWGTPILDLDGDGDVDEQDGKVSLAHSGIAPRPVVIFRKDGGKTIAIGTETVEDQRFKVTDCVGDDCPDDDNKYCKVDCVTPEYWRQNEKLREADGD